MINNASLTFSVGGSTLAVYNQCWAREVELVSLNKRFSVVLPFLYNLVTGNYGGGKPKLSHLDKCAGWIMWTCDVVGSSSVFKDMAGSHAELFGLRMLHILCLQNVQGTIFSWASTAENMRNCIERVTNCILIVNCE